MLGGAGRGAQSKRVFVLAALSSGTAVRVDLDVDLEGAGTAGGGIHGPPLTKVKAKVRVDAQFHFHSGCVRGLSAEGDGAVVGALFATAGDDRRVCVWDASNRELVARTVVKV